MRRFSATLAREITALLTEVKLRGMPAHAVAAERLLARIEAANEPAPLPGQFPLWEPDGSPWRGRLGPSVPIACDRFGAPGRPAILPLRTCLQRQDAKWPGKRAPIYDFCGSGKCEQGLGYRLRAAYSAAEDWASRSKHHRPTYQPYRRDAGAQRRRQRELLLAEERIPTIDTPPAEELEVAEAIPKKKP